MCANETRAERGDAIDGLDVTTLGAHWACVKSQTDADKSYTVDMSGDTPECECPDYVYRGVVCKHLIAAARELDKIELQTT